MKPLRKAAPTEWIAAQIAVMEACNRQTDAEFAVLTTEPTTLAGVIAVLAGTRAG
jgi:hypothetical protein